MAKVKLGFKDLQVPEQFERSRLIQTRMTGNIHFASPNPSLADMKLATDALEKAFTESRGRDKNKCAIMRLRRKEMLTLVSQLGAYVQNASGGDKEIILSSGFDVAKHNSIVPPVTQVLNLRARDGKAADSVKLIWKKVTGAKVYLVRVMLNNYEPEKAELKATPSASRCEIAGLTVGAKYYIEVAAIGGGIIGNWSDPVGFVVG